MRKLFIIAAATLLFAVVGCETLETISEIGTAVAVASGDLTPEQAESINHSATAVGKVFDRITPEQEYYIGRAVAATILEAYKPYDNAAATLYINEIGQALAMASDMPETYGGYHFLIMDTDEINAFSAPGGLVLVSRGMLRCCRNETEVASVLAHEIGHVEHKDGLRAIKKSRLTTAFTVLGTEAAKNLGSEDLATLTKSFEGAISDVTKTMINSGYARKQEREADEAAVTIMKRIGYNPAGLRNMLAEMGKKMSHDKRGFAKTHPAPKDRINDIAPLLKGFGPVQPNAVRTARFNRALGNI